MIDLILDLIPVVAASMLRCCQTEVDLDSLLANCNAQSRSWPHSSLAVAAPTRHRVLGLVTCHPGHHAEMLMVVVDDVDTNSGVVGPGIIQHHHNCWISAVDIAL